MNTPWILGTLAAIAFFAYFEARAFRHPDRQNTLSRWIYNMGSKWPLSIWLMGVFCGGLAVHFFWHWDPTCAPPGVSGSILTIPREATIPYNDLWRLKTPLTYGG